MKKHLISLGLVSFASVLVFSSCNTVAAAKTNEPAVVQNDGDHRGLPHYRASDLPNEDEIYDLTKELNYKNTKPATVKEVEEFLEMILGPNILAMAKDAFPELYNSILKYNVLTSRDIYDLSGMAGKIIKIITGGDVDAEDLVVDIATKVELDKFYYLVHCIRADKKAYNQFKQFVISVSNGMLVQTDYRSAHAFLKGDSLKVEAASEEKTWDDFKIIGNDLEAVDGLQQFFNDPNVRVGLRFINLAAKVLAKNLTKHELGFIFTTGFHLINDPEYAEICMRYMMNNASSFVHHLGNVLKGINITNDSWAKALLGIATIARATNDGLGDEDSYIAVDNLIATINEENIDFIYNSINPAGVRVLFKFIGNFLLGLPKDLINNVMLNYEHPDTIDVLPFTQVFEEQYGRLSRNEKRALDEQLELFGIDFENFNLIIEGFDPGTSNPFEYLMGVLNTNIVEPFENYFVAGIKSDDIYPNYKTIDSEKGIEFEAGYIKLIYKQNEEVTSEDLDKYFKDKNSMHVYFYTTYYTNPTYQSINDNELKEDEEHNIVFKYRSDFTVEGLKADGNVDTSKLGQHELIVKYHVAIPLLEWNDDHTATTPVVDEYDFEWKLFYYVVDKNVNVITSGFKNELYLDPTENYSKETDAFKDANGNVGFVNFKNVLTLKQNTSYVANTAFIESESDSIYVYDETEKRFIQVSDKECGYTEIVSRVDVSTLSTTNLGLHYGFYEKQFKKDSDIKTVKMVFVYNVVETINLEVSDGFFDPGFGW